MNSNPNLPPQGTAETGVMLHELVDGAARVLENANDLYREAAALHSVGALSRALFLHQISLEECAKFEMLGTWAVGVLMGMEPDMRKLTAALASHKAKNYTNAYLLPATSAERDAKREKRWSEAIDAFKAQQAEFHLESNSAKNASLYVDFQGGTFAAPKDRISEAMVSKIAVANEEYLVGARSKLEMMRGWLRNPQHPKDLMNWFLARLTEIGSEHPDDPEHALAVIMEEMMARAKDTGYVDAMKEHLEDRDSRRN